MNLKKKYLSSAALLLLSTIVVKVIGAVYKIPLTSYIGAVGRGYFAYAYNLCMPIHAITMGVFPVALSKLVSKCYANNDSYRAYAFLKSANRLFTLIGFCGMLVILAFSKPYAAFIAHSDKSILTILVIAPSVLFSCMSASFRGYYEGRMNMLPTAVSQMLEAVFKLVFGLLFARASMAYFFNVYQETHCVFGELVSSDSQAFSLIYPVTSAFAMLGVTLGTFISLCFLWLYNVSNANRITISPDDLASAKRAILSFSFPIMLGTAIQSVFQFLDASSIQLALNHTDSAFLSCVYASCLTNIDASSPDLTTYIYGIYSASLDFKNIVPGVTMALGVCAVPAVSSAFEAGDKPNLGNIVNSIYKYTTLLSLLGGFAIAVSSNEILSLFYGSSSRDIVVGANSLVYYSCLSIWTYSLAGVSMFMAQAIGCAKKTIAPCIASGIIRVVLNYVLISQTRLVLLGSVISGAVGYFVLLLWCTVIVKRHTKITLSYPDLLLKPLIIGVLTLAFMKISKNLIICLSNFALILLLKTSILSVFYCILCLFVGAIKPSEILSLFEKKKMA